MPNHVTSRLKFFGEPKMIAELVEKFSTFYPATPHTSFDGDLTFINGENEYGWLNESSNIFTTRDKATHVGVPDGFVQKFETEWTRFPDFEKIIAPPNDPAYSDKPNQEAAKNSPNWWYTWNLNNWGTKWNCYSCEKISDDEYKFETAWSSVKELIGEIAKQFPDIKINYTYADEDTGSNCGKLIFEKGLCYTHIPVNGTDDAYDIYFELNPDQKDNYIKTAKGYEYVED